MDLNGKNFAIAVTLTVLDFSVAARYGTAVWQAYELIAGLLRAGVLRNS